MAASLALEAIGDNTPRLPGLLDLRIPQPWVAEIVGERRIPLKGKKDYTRANSVGSRGVFMHYILQERRVYEVFARTSWRASERYFCRVRDGEIERLGEADVLDALLEAVDAEVNEWLSEG